MLTQCVHTFGQQDVSVVVCMGLPYFRAADVTTILGYKSSAKAIRAHVTDKYVRTLQQLSETASRAILINAPNRDIHCTELGHSFLQAGKPPLYLCESGVYELAFQSTKPEAVRFREWVVEVALPEIRQTGRFVREQQMCLMNETDLHYKVVQFIRKFWLEAIIVPGLGELQDTSEKRIDAWKKGYKSGQPDILILNCTRKASGLALEFKTPLVMKDPSPQQEAFLQYLKSNRYETLVSNSYDEIIVKVLEYRETARRCIPRIKVRSSVE